MNQAALNSTALTRWLPRVAPLLLVVAALCYYGSYIGFWFNPHDEGGTAAFTAMRLLAGEAPIRDVELGYNVGWYFPIVALFKMTGVNFLVMRGYFFALSTITALLGWLLVRRLTRNEWLALAVGLVLVFFPGSQFKNYNPLLVVANMLCIANAALAAGQTERRFRWSVVAGGLVLGLTLLTRIDLGFLFTLLWIGFLVLRLCEVGIPFARRAGAALVAAAILVAGVVATHTPAWLAAKSGGYAKEFTAQYGMWADYLGSQARTVTGTKAPAAAAASTAKVDRTTLPRMTWSAAGTAPDKRVLVFLTYLPPLAYVLLFAWLALRLAPAVMKGAFTIDDPASLALLLLIGSLAAFPQFFFFRPDRPHLSEFMPGYIVATVSAVALFSGRARWFIAALLAVQFGLYGWYALDHYSAGTIAARWSIKKNKRQLFTGENGVRVWVHKDKDFPELEGVRRAVEEHSKPGEWLVCYPYQPGYNVMTARPSYERNVYQDNATAPRGWPQRAIARIEEKKPAVVVIDDRAINKVEASRFSVWAAPVMEHLRAHYEPRAKFDTIEVFARKP